MEAKLEDFKAKPNKTKKISQIISMETKLKKFKEKPNKYTKNKKAKKRSHKYSSNSDHSHLRIINLHQLNIELTPKLKM